MIVLLRHSGWNVRWDHSGASKGRALGDKGWITESQMMYG